jgi:DNA-binding MarR family transcriptional regulator
MHDEHENLLEQARLLYKTIQDLKASVLLKNAPVNAGLECAAKELTLPQMTTLVVIRDAGEMSLKELAEATQVSPPAASAMVDRLVDLGMVTREPSTVDRREVRLALSADGEMAVNVMESQLLGALVELLEKLGPETASQWCEVYGRIQGILDEEKESRRKPASSANRRSSVA